MSEHMVEDGYAATSITNVDISPVVIDQMRKKHPEMDCTPPARLMPLSLSLTSSSSHAYA
jgi:hypothetical protein